MAVLEVKITVIKVIKVKTKQMVKFLKIWAEFLGTHTDLTVWKYV